MMRIILISFVCLISSCAYYNTFYNAKKYYSEAQNSGRNKDELLSKSIEKCAKVIKYYPGSKWVDDAILLMGKCFYEKGDYPSARRKFQELLNYFPNSSLVEEATLYLGKSYLSEGDYTFATETFEKLLNTKFKCDALFYTAEAMFASEDYEEAATAYQNLLKSCPNSSFREKALETLAASLLKMAEYTTAIELYQTLLKGKMSEEERLEISLRISDAYLDLDEPEKALEILLKVDKDIVDNLSKAKVRLRLSECYRKLGKLDEALYSLEEASQLAPKSETSAFSYFHQGMIYEEDLLDFDKAREAYEQVSTEYKAAEVANEAKHKVAILNRLKELKMKLLEESEVDTAETEFLLAELLLTELKKPDLAIEEYQKVIAGFGDNKYRPKAIYAIAWIYENLKEDPATAKKYLQQLIQEYPKTAYAERAREILGEQKKEN